MAIKIFRSSDASAPALTGQIGSLITVLDAVLVNGYNSVSVSSITRESSTATVTTSTPHGLNTGDSVLISGAAQPEYNVDAQVNVLSLTSFTYAVSNSPATPATGSISAKRASAGFTKTFSGSNKAAYRSNDLSSNRHTLRVVDDGSSSAAGGEARVYAYESMSDIDTGINVYPTPAMSANGFFWRKSAASSAIARPWMIATDGKLVYFFFDYNSTLEQGMNGAYIHSGVFGDIISFKPGDAYAVILSGNTTAAATTTMSGGAFNCQTSITAPTTFTNTFLLARDYTAVPGPKYASLYGSGLSQTCLGSTVAMSYPHLIDSGFYVAPVVVVQGGAGVALIRGRMPGIYEPLHGRCFNNGDLISGIQGLPGKTLMMVYGNASSSLGCFMLDITGPWDS